MYLINKLNLNQILVFGYVVTKNKMEKLAIIHFNWQLNNFKRTNKQTNDWISEYS